MDLAMAPPPPLFDLQSSLYPPVDFPSPSLSSSAASSAAAAAAFILQNPHTALPSLMPNKFSLLDDDRTLTELEFQDIHRFLSQETSEGKVLTPKQNSSTNQPLNTYTKRKERHAETQGLETLEKTSPLVRRECPGGKENVLYNKTPPRRRGFFRREGSSRITTHRPFKVDLRSFGSILNKDALRDSQIPRDVHAFWEAEDEKEALEAIMRKVRGEDNPCSQQSEQGSSGLRRPSMRRKGSQRITRSRPLKLDLSLYAKQLQELDAEQLEEEEEAVNVESCTFSKHLELTRDKNLHTCQSLEMSDSEPRTSPTRNLNIECFDFVPSDEPGKTVEFVDTDDEMQIVLSEGDSPALSTREDGHHAGNQAHIIASINPQSEDLKGRQAVLQDSDIVQTIPEKQNVVPFISAVGQTEGHMVEKVGVGLEDAMKVTPFGKSAVDNRTPYTSPTPPSNPLAAIGYQNGNMPDGIGKRKLDFEDTIDSPAMASQTSVEKDSPCLQKVSTSPVNTVPVGILESSGYKKGNIPEDIGKRKLDFEDTVDFPVSQPSSQTSTEKDSSCMQMVSASPVKTVQEKSPVCRQETTLVCSKFIDNTSIKSTPQTKVLKKKTAKKKRVAKDRNSLAGAGTTWDKGIRHSTRIRSRPLQYWRGERFLYGRVHQSLTTLIGIKYSSPPLRSPVYERPKFKVESYVSDKYADLIRFAAQ